jgi:hypothetical protein
MVYLSLPILPVRLRRVIRLVLVSRLHREIPECLRLCHLNPATQPSHQSNIWWMDWNIAYPNNIRLDSDYW